MADQQPITRADLDAGLTTLKAELIEAMCGMQTEVLRAFQSWARPADIRMRGLNTNVQGFNERLALIEERASRIERGGVS